MSRIWHVHGEETMCVVLTLSLIHILLAVMPNPYLIDSHARTPACMPDSCQNNELCLIPIIPWQMPPAVAILYSREFEQNGWGFVRCEWHSRSSPVGSRNGKGFHTASKWYAKFSGNFLEKCISVFPSTHPSKFASTPQCVHYLSAFKIFKITFMNLSF